MAQRYVMALAFLACLGAAGQAQNATSMAAALLQSHPYLLDEGTRPVVDEANRQIREAEATLRKNDAAPEDRTQAEADRAAAEKRLAAALEGVPSTVRVSFAEGRPVLEPAGPFEMPGDAGALLLRVDGGAGDSTLAVVQRDFTESDTPIEIPVAATGTTWALLSLKNVPLHRTTARLRFAQADAEPVVTMIDLTTPERGRLKMTVLSDDNGEPAPSMVRLLWKVDGQVRRPANGIDFNPQFDHQGNRARVANLQGALRGEYWCVPGPVDMVLPAGEWEVTVRRGGEHVPVVDTLTVTPNETVERTYRPRRWADMREHGWYSGDDHVHCQILSDDDAERLMTWAKAEDVHLCNIVKMGDIYRTFFEQRGFGKDYRVVDGDYVLSPGQECPRTHDDLGHTIMMNITSMVRDTDRYFLYDEVFDEVHKQGGLAGYAHVNSGIFHVHRDMSMNIPKDKVDFVELLQFASIDTGLYYDFLNTGFKVTASAGSDVPWGGTIGEVRVYAHTGKRGRFDADKWFDAVKQGHTFVTNGPMLEFTVDDAIPGDRIDLKNDEPLRVRARAWGDREAFLPAKLEIVKNGDVVKTIEGGSDPAATELAADFEVEPGQGFWIAARAESVDGAKAHTTPVYVVRPGLRFWKYEQVDELIGKRLSSLDEIEQIVADRTARNERGELEGDRYGKQLAVQGPLLLERVLAARQIYADLKQTAEKERPLRGGRP